MEVAAGCPVCSTPLGEPFVRRAALPVLLNVLVDTPAQAAALPRGDLELRRCPACDLTVNAAFEPALMEYGEGYENLQACSEFFDAYVDGLVARLVESGVRNQQVIEVGAGTGYFLAKLCEQGGNTGVGFDPAYRGPEEPAPGVRMVADHYGPDHAGVAADVVVCRHVIEHLPRPLELLESLRETLADAGDPRVVFETPALEWILGGVVFQDFFYEHCSYFSEDSLGFALRRAGFEPRVLERVFGGQYLWAEARLAEGDSAAPPGGVLEPAVERYRAAEREALAAAAAALQAAAADGPVVVWGAGAKGVTFVNLLDPAGTQVAAVVDINPNKIGRFVPGTGHPIVGPDFLAREGVATVFLMNPNYAEECRTMAAELGATPQFLTQDTAWR